MKIAMPPHLKKQIPPQPNAAVPFLSREPPAEPPTIEPPVIPPLENPTELEEKLLGTVRDLRAMADYLEAQAERIGGVR